MKKRESGDKPAQNNYEHCIVHTLSMIVGVEIKGLSMLLSANCVYTITRSHIVYYKIVILTGEAYDALVNQLSSSSLSKTQMLMNSLLNMMLLKGHC